MKKIFLIIALLFGLAVVAFLVILFFVPVDGDANSAPSKPTPTQMIAPSSYNPHWKLISASVGEVANVFSWGFNRHICYDESQHTFWIFYFRTLPEGNPGQIVYRYTTNNGTTWSNEQKFSQLKNDAADFTISCHNNFIDVAYGKLEQDGVFWRRGRMEKNKISWFVQSIPMPIGKVYSRAIPAITYFHNLPVVSAHDQTEQNIGGHKRAFVAIANDPDGKTWNDQAKIFDEVIELNNSALAFTSVSVAKDTLFALTQANNGTDMSVYLSDNRWSDATTLADLPITGGTPEWVTLTDTTGIAHVFYPISANVSASRQLGHATFDGTHWQTEVIPVFGKIDLNQLSAAVDPQQNTLWIIAGNMIVGKKEKDNWQIDSKILAAKKPRVAFITMTEQVNDGKLGIAWVDGAYTNPRVWFTCLDTHGDTKKKFVQLCN